MKWKFAKKKKSTQHFISSSFDGVFFFVMFYIYLFSFINTRKKCSEVLNTTRVSALSDRFAVSEMTNSTSSSITEQPSIVHSKIEKQRIS